MHQSQALEILKSGANVFLTGAPGSGKTYVLNQFIRWAQRTSRTVAKTASTGIAATHIDGQTIHSFSGIGVHEWLSEADLSQIRIRRRRIIAKTDILVIDEISMLHAYTFDLINQACQYVRDSELPFGGMQVVLCGDLFQLPPVQASFRRHAQDAAPEEGLVRARAPYAEAGLDPQGFITQSLAWQTLQPVVCYLDEQHRQQDHQLLSVLTNIRANAVTQADKDVLATRIGVQPRESDVTVHLFPTNAQADKLNAARLAAIDEQPMTYDSTSAGTKAKVDQLRKSMLAPDHLILKQGATVMALRNDANHDFVNGSLGTVVGFTPQKRGGWPIVEFANGNTVTVKPADWEMMDGDRVVASVTQVPLRLAYGITIHKSQGMTLDSAVMDLSRTFADGMGYVALSRVERLDGMYLRGINDRAYRVANDATLLDEQLHAADSVAVGLLEAHGNDYFAQHSKTQVSHTYLVAQALDGQILGQGSDHTEENKSVGNAISANLADHSTDSIDEFNSSGTEDEF